MMFDIESRKILFVSSNEIIQFNGLLDIHEEYVSYAVKTIKIAYIYHFGKRIRNIDQSIRSWLLQGIF